MFWEFNMVELEQSYVHLLFSNIVEQSILKIGISLNPTNKIKAQ